MMFLRHKNYIEIMLIDTAYNIQYSAIKIIYMKIMERRHDQSRIKEKIDA